MRFFCSSHVQYFLAAPPSGKPIVNHWESYMARPIRKAPIRRGKSVTIRGPVAKKTGKRSQATINRQEKAMRKSRDTSSVGKKGPSHENVYAMKQTPTTTGKIKAHKASAAKSKSPAFKKLKRRMATRAFVGQYRRAQGRTSKPSRRAN